MSGGQTFVKDCLVSADGVAATPDGVRLDSASYWDGNPEVALDGAEFFVVSEAHSSDAVHLTRVSLDGAAIPQASGGFGAAFVAPGAGETATAPIVARVGDRALVLWRTWSITTGANPELAGALVFPRREDLRRAAIAPR